MDKLDLEAKIMFLYIFVPLLRCKNFPKAQKSLPEGSSNKKQNKVIKHFLLVFVFMANMIQSGQPGPSS